MLKGLTSHPIESVRMWASRMIAGYESRIDHEIEYEEEQKELFSQYKQDLKSIAAGQGLWLSSKALAVVLVVSNSCWLWLESWFIIGRGRSAHRDYRCCFHVMRFAAQIFARRSHFHVGLDKKSYKLRHQN